MTSPTHTPHTPLGVATQEKQAHESETVQNVLQEQEQMPLRQSTQESREEAREETQEESREKGQEKHEEGQEGLANEVHAEQADDTPIIVKEPEYFTMPPKRTPPPRKSREERGLPPSPPSSQDSANAGANASDAPQALPNAYTQEGMVPTFDATDATGASDEKSGNDAQTGATQEAGGDEASEAAQPMTLMGHLGELRTRLVRSFIAVGFAFVLCYSFAERLFAELCRPLIAALPEGSKLIFTALPEAFFVYLQVGLVAAIFLASPYLFYQIWAFVTPGLYDEEKKYMAPMALISAIFFITGASFCFFVVFPYAFTFFVGFASEDIAAMPSLSQYLGFALKLLIAFGLIFEMPLFTFFLARMGLVTAERMRKVRRYSVLCIFIIAAILTPPDVISQLLMAFPMILLYELSIGVAVIFGRKKKKETEQDHTDAHDDNHDETSNSTEKKESA